MILEQKKTDPFKILVVEDSPSARFKIMESLQSLDAVILEADDGTTALSILKKDPETIDLVLSDQVMKLMNGDELCKAIRNEPGIKDIPVIILSTKTDKDTVLKLFQAGVNDYLFKPFTPQELLARLQAHLDQQKLHKVLKQNIKELSDLNRMKDHFLAACSHDFKTPLQGIMGYAELLMIEEGLNDSHHEMLNNIIHAVTQLNELIESLLDFSLAGHRPENISMHQIDLFSIIRSCINSISFMAKNKNIQLRIASSPSLPLSYGNANALSRIFNNLLSNAIKFSTPDSEIIIALQKNADNTVSISIKDTGLGILEEDIPFIFDRFSKASRQGTQGEKSTGLGLYITNQLVELHNGKIDVSSQIKKGSCFTVTLPLIQENLVLATREKEMDLVSRENQHDV